MVQLSLKDGGLAVIEEKRHFALLFGLLILLRKRVLRVALEGVELFENGWVGEDFVVVDFEVSLL